MKMLLALLMIMSNFTACVQAGDGTPLQQKNVPAQTTLNIAYGKDSLQKLDVYLPANRSVDSTKVIVLIHGGGWAGGDKAEFAAAIPVLQQKLPQYAIVNLNYRLANQLTNHFPTQENDVKAALQFIVDHAEAYKISKDFVLLGASAGAHLALLQAYKYTDPIVPKAVISFFGPADMADLYNSTGNSYYQMGLQLLIGGTPTTKPAVFVQASPIHFVGKQSPPTLLLHGGRDGLVPAAQSKKLKKELDKLGVPSDLVVYANEGHGWQGANLTDAYNRIAQFLNTHMER
jgi:acetyl esterase/lipase